MNKKTTNAVTASISNDLLVISFDNGNAGVVTICVSELSGEIRHAALMHGLKQKLVDAAAIARDPETGRSATPSDKYAAVNAVADRLLRGEWNATARGEGGTASGGLLYRAIMRLYPDMGDTRVRAFLEAKTDKEKAAMRATARVAAMIETIRAESGAKRGSVDEAELFSGLE